MTIHCSDKTIHFSTPRVMGIVNLTPDSFYNGSRFVYESEVLLQVEKMLHDGADMIDLGGMSTRPGAGIIAPDEELERVLLHVGNIVRRFPETVISIDTIHAKVADECLHAGAHIINDITAGTYDAAMLAIVARHGAPYILMHMQGHPADMQQQPQYTDVVGEVLAFLKQRMELCSAAGIKQMIIDPGFGFGKTVEHNYTLLKHLRRFTALGVPVLAGLSRKSMICKVLHVNPDNALNGTTAANMLALQNGANLLRVHDVKETKEAIAIWQQYGKG